MDDQGVKLIHSDSDHKSMLWNHHIICSLSLTTILPGFTEINYVLDIYLHFPNINELSYKSPATIFRFFLTIKLFDIPIFKEGLYYENSYKI